MKVFIVGGTGFLGYFATLEFLKRGHSVSSLSIPDIELGDWFPAEVNVHYSNIFKMEHAEFVKLFQGFDAMVYAVGPDDRVTPPAPAYEFFHERLVRTCGRIFDAAREAEIRKCTLLNSYFAYFDRIWPESKLAKHHPYIKCRVEQANRVIAAAKEIMDVSILELPYIFGAMPCRIPIWKDVLLERVLKMKPLMFPKGGTNMIAVQSVGEAIVGAIEQGEYGKRYQVGDVNMSWKKMLTLMFNILGIKKRIITIPTFIAAMYGKRLKKKEEEEGRESGLDLSRLFQDIQSKKLYFDPSDSAKRLGYTRRGVHEAIYETLQACYPGKIYKSLSESIDV